MFQKDATFSASAALFGLFFCSGPAISRALFPQDRPRKLTVSFLLISDRANGVQKHQTVEQNSVCGF